jgi:hypothetical protein
MTLKRLTRLDKIIIVLIVLDIFVIIFPWQLVPYDNFLKSLYRILLHSIWTGALFYSFYRLNGNENKIKWIIRQITWLFLLLGFFLIGRRLIFFGLPAEFGAITLYEKENNINEKVLRIFYRGFLPTQGHFEFKRILDVPEWNFRFETDFEKSDLNGIWKVYDMDNEFNYVKTVYYIDGEIKEIISTNKQSTFEE